MTQGILGIHIQRNICIFNLIKDIKHLFYTFGYQ